MDQKKILKQMIEFQNVTFNNAFNANALLQDQAELMTRAVLDQSTWLPPEGRKAIETWFETCKTGRNNFKKSVDDSYKQVNQFFAE